MDNKDMENAMTINEFMLDTLGSIQADRLGNAQALNRELKGHIVTSLREIESSKVLKNWENAVAFSMLQKARRENAGIL